MCLASIQRTEPALYGAWVVHTYIVHTGRLGAGPAPRAPESAPHPMPEGQHGRFGRRLEEVKSTEPHAGGHRVVSIHGRRQAGMQWRRRAGGLDGECQRRPSSSPCQPASPCGPRGGGGEEDGKSGLQKGTEYRKERSSTEGWPTQHMKPHGPMGSIGFSLRDGTVPSARHAAWVKVGPLLHFRITLGRADECRWPGGLLAFRLPV